MPDFKQRWCGWLTFAHKIKSNHLFPKNNWCILYRTSKKFFSVLSFFFYGGRFYYTSIIAKDTKAVSLALSEVSLPGPHDKKMMSALALIITFTIQWLLVWVFSCANITTTESYSIPERNPMSTGSHPLICSPKDMLTTLLSHLLLLQDFRLPAFFFFFYFNQPLSILRTHTIV